MRTKPTETRKSKTFPESLDVERKCYRKNPSQTRNNNWMIVRKISLHSRKSDRRPKNALSDDRPMLRIRNPSEYPLVNEENHVEIHGFPRTIIYLHGGCSEDFPVSAISMLIYQKVSHVVSTSNPQHFLINNPIQGEVPNFVMFVGL